MGDIRRRLGWYEPAATAYRNAIGLYKQMLAESEDDPVRVQLARACNELGRTLRLLRQIDEAKRMHETAIATLAEATKSFADRPACRYELACSYYELSLRDMFLQAGPKKDGPGPPGKGKPPGPPPKSKGEGEGPVWRAIDLLEGVIREFPTVPEYRHLLACCYRELPPGRPGGGPMPKMNPDRAVELLRQLVAEFPNVPDYRLDLCEALASKGPPGRGRDAETSFGGRLQEAIAESRKLVDNYPTVPEYAAAHARYLDRLGMNLFEADKLEEAEKQHRKAVAVQRKLVKQHPGVVVYDLWLCLMERCLGRTVGARGAFKEARELLEGATSRVEAMWQKDRRLEGVRPFLGLAYRDLANVLEKSKEPALALAARAKAEQFEGKAGR